jgi:hypothetical protein
MLPILETTHQSPEMVDKADRYHVIPRSVFTDFEPETNAQILSLLFSPSPLHTMRAYTRIHET